MFHLVSYKCISITLLIPQFGGELQGSGKIVEVCLTCEELSGGYLQEEVRLVLCVGSCFIFLFFSSILISSLIIFF